MFAWITLAVILTVGTVGIKAEGIIVNGGADQQECTEDEGIFYDVLGIIISTGAPELAGVMIADAPCRNGVMIAD